MDDFPSGLRGYTRRKFHNADSEKARVFADFEGGGVFQTVFAQKTIHKMFTQTRSGMMRIHSLKPKVPNMSSKTEIYMLCILCCAVRDGNWGVWNKDMRLCAN